MQNAIMSYSSTQNQNKVTTPYIEAGNTQNATTTYSVHNESEECKCFLPPCGNAQSATMPHSIPRKQRCKDADGHTKDAECKKSIHVHNETEECKCPVVNFQTKRWKGKEREYNNREQVTKRRMHHMVNDHDNKRNETTQEYTGSVKRPR